MTYKPFLLTIAYGLVKSAKAICSGLASGVAESAFPVWRSAKTVSVNDLALRKPRCISMQNLCASVLLRCDAILAFPSKRNLSFGKDLVKERFRCNLNGNLGCTVYWLVNFASCQWLRYHMQMRAELPRERISSFLDFLVHTENVTHVGSWLNVLMRLGKIAFASRSTFYCFPSSN